MMTIPYPFNYFDPYGDEPTHTYCRECVEFVDIQDANPVDSHDAEGDWVCDWCADLRSKK